jgi:hypothetical protein
VIRRGTLAGISTALSTGMGKQARSIRFRVARADVGVLLGDLHAREPSILFARVFTQLSAAVANPSPPSVTEIDIYGAHAEAFREWLERTSLRYAKKGDSVKARAFARVRDSEDSTD